MASYDDTATVSGSVVSIENGADEVGAESCVVTVSPTLSGVSSVSETQTGRNLLINNGVDILGSGLSFVVNSDKSVTISGLATANAFFTFFENVLFKASSYMIRGSGNSNVQIIVRRGTASGSNIRTASTSDIAWNLAEDTSCACVIRVASGTDLTTPITVYPQIEIGSSLSDYETAIFTTHTASLGRTIYGGTADIVNGTGKDTCARIKISDLNWAYYTAGENPIFYANNVPNMKTYARAEMPNIAIDGYTTRTAHSRSNLSTNMANMECSAIENAQTITFRNDTYTSVSDMITALGDEYIVYELATSTDFTFNGQEIPTKQGYNAFWSEQGNTELTYYKDGYGVTSVTVHKETPEGEPVEETRKFHRIIYEGQVDVIRGTGLINIGESGTEYDPPEQISFTPVEIATDEGENTFYADEGVSVITYRREVE